MSAKKLEKLIELVVNEDRETANQLFHEIIVEKSREIYESIMAEDQSMGFLDEIEDEDAGMDGMMEDEDEFETEEEIDGDFDTDGDEEEFGAEEEFGDEEFGADDEEFGDEEGSEELEDRVVDLEDKLDQLMADFEAQMGDDTSDEEFDDEEADLDADEEEADLDAEEDAEDEVMESVSLKKVPGLYSSKIGGDNGEQTKSTVAFNSGKRGMEGTPVNYDAGAEESQASGPKKATSYVTKGQGKLIGDVANTPGKDAGKSSFKDKAAQQYGDSKGKTSREVGTGGSVKQEKRSVVPEGKRSAKKRI